MREDLKSTAKMVQTLCCVEGLGVRVSSIIRIVSKYRIGIVGRLWGLRAL